MREVWKQIPKYEKYEISTLGKVRSFRSKKILKTQINNNGYEQIMYDRNGPANIRLYVSRLVLLTFIGSYPEKMEASHLNGKRTDNRLSNLVWETRKENLNRVKRFKIKLFNFQIVTTIRKI